MRQVFISLIKTAKIEIERTNNGWRLSGSGLLGVLAVVVTLFGIVKVVPWPW